MKKKVISILLVGAMVASMGAMAGCGSSSGSSSTGGDTSAAGESGSDSTTAQSSDGTITIWAWDSSFNIPAIQAAIDAYVADHPEAEGMIEVQEQSQSSDIETVITNAASAGNYETLPDITLFQDHYIQQYVANYPNAWNSDINSSDIDWDSFAAEKLDYSTIDGVHYGVPVDNGVVVAAYRTDLLEQAGYTIDDLTGCSWDEFIEIGEKVYETTGKYLLCMDGDGNDLIYMMAQAEGVSQFKDGEPYLSENETLVEIINKIVEMQEKKVLYLANDWSDYTDQCIQGDMVAGVINGNWIMATISKVEANQGKWALTTMPTLAGGDGYAANGGSSLYVTSNCDNVDLATDFLAYTFGGGDGATATYEGAFNGGGVISTWSGASGYTLTNSDAYKALDGTTNTYDQLVEWGSNVPVIEQSDYHYKCRSYLAAAIQNILNGTDAASAISDAESQLRFDMGL